MKSSVPRLAHHLPSDTPGLQRCSASFGHGSPQKPCCCAEAAAIYVSTVFTKLIYPSYTLHIIAIFRSYYSSAFSYLRSVPHLVSVSARDTREERCTDSASRTESRSRSPFLTPLVSYRLLLFEIEGLPPFGNCAD